MQSSVNQQLETLRKSARLAWLPMGSLALTFALLALGLITGYEAFFVLAAFIGLGAVAARQTAPHWRNAIRALEEGERSKGKVSIIVSEYDDSPEYRVTSLKTPTGSWSFEFSPQNWIPVEGCFDADILFVSGVEWPALVITQEGILFPSFDPKKA